MDVDILDPLNMQSCNFPVPGDTDTNKKKVVICGQVPEPERRSRSVISASPGLRKEMKFHPQTQTTTSCCWW